MKSCPLLCSTLIYSHLALFQFWAAYVPCEAQHRDAVQLTLEQIDVIKRLTDRYSPQLTTCTSSDGKSKLFSSFQFMSLFKSL